MYYFYAVFSNNAITSRLSSTNKISFNLQLLSFASTLMSLSFSSCFEVDITSISLLAFP